MLKQGRKREAKGLAVLYFIIGLIILLIILAVIYFALAKLDYSDKLDPEATMRPYVEQAQPEADAEPVEPEVDEPEAPAGEPVPEDEVDLTEPTEAPTPEPTPEPTEAPTPEPTPEPTPAGPTPTPVAAGTYTYEGPKGKWTVDLRDDGLFTLTDPEGRFHTGEGWVTEADGTVTCGPTDIYFEEFAFNGGCSRWSVSGKKCTPVIP